MFKEIGGRFDALRKNRRIHPQVALEAVGETVAMCLEMLERDCDRHGIEWQGGGAKTYSVYAIKNVEYEFSRAVRDDLFISDPEQFRSSWRDLVTSLAACRGSKLLQGVVAGDIDRLYCTAVTAFAVAFEVSGSRNRGAPGTFFEMSVGPAVSLLAGIDEGSSVKVPVPDQPGVFERITTDISFDSGPESTVLVLPTKISTRERISQAYVHQAILEKSDPTRVYRSALCIGAETNMFVAKGEARSVGSAFARDTLVPRTIVLYQRYIAQLSALYYLDMPHEYEVRPLPGFPDVRPFSDLLTTDLPGLLAG